VAIAWFCPLAHAGLIISSRYSLLSTNIEFGYVGSVVSSTDTKTSTLIEDSALTSHGAATDGAPIGDVSWDASYQYQLDQQFYHNSSQGLSASGSTNLFSFAAGEGVSHLLATNLLEVVFENTHPSNFNLLFNHTDDSTVSIDLLISPNNWESLFTTSSESSVASITLQLAAGIFRAKAESNVNTDNGFANAGAWMFEIVAVPEPTAMTLIMVAYGVLMTCRTPRPRELCAL
jgi:hypothetical protein